AVIGRKLPDRRSGSSRPPCPCPCAYPCPKVPVDPCPKEPVPPCPKPLLRRTDREGEDAHADTVPLAPHRAAAPSHRCWPSARGTDRRHRPEPVRRAETDRPDRAPSSAA